MIFTKEQVDYILENFVLTGRQTDTPEQASKSALKQLEKFLKCRMHADSLDLLKIEEEDGDSVINVIFDDADMDFPVCFRMMDGDAIISQWLNFGYFKTLTMHLNQIMKHIEDENS